MSDVHLKLQDRFPNLTLVHNKTVRNFVYILFCDFLVRLPLFLKNPNRRGNKIVYLLNKHKEKKVESFYCVRLIVLLCKGLGHCCVLCEETCYSLGIWCRSLKILVITSPGYHSRSIHLHCVFLTQEQTQKN